MRKNLFLLFLTIITTSNIQIVNAQSWNLTGNSSTKSATNFVGTTDNKALAFRTNNIEQMRISNIGYIGIGTKNPQTKLHIENGPFVNLSSPGCIQIGATSSTNLGMDYSAIQARYKGAASRLYLNYFGGDVWIGAHNTNPTAALYVSEDGRVVVGSNAVSLYALTVASSAAYFGNIYSSNTGNGTGIDAESTYGTGAFGYSAYGYGVYAEAENNNGLYAVTLNNASYYAGYFVGDVYSTTGVYAGSDQRLKQNIKDFASAMDIINQLKPKQYAFRHDGNYKLMNLPQGEHYGLIAQDVEKILPNLVKESKFDIDKATSPKHADIKNASVLNDKKSGETIDFKALNYTELIPIMIKGMQEQQQTIDKQQQVNEQLQVQITELKKIVQSSSQNKNFNYNSSATKIYLAQNTPNPFSADTKIQYTLPEQIKSAVLIISSADGKSIQSYSLNTSGIITIHGNTLPAGQYTYSLLADGKMLDTKSMILTK